MRYGIFLLCVRSRMSLRLLVCVHAQPQRLAGPEERGKFPVHRDGFTISWIAAQPRGAAPGGEGTKAAQFHPIAAGKRRGDFVEDCRDDGCNGTAASFGVRRRSLLVGMDRWLAGTSVRSRSREGHYRRRNEPEAAQRRRGATTASAGLCSFDGSPGSWPSLR